MRSASFIRNLFCLIFLIFKIENDSCEWQRINDGYSITFYLLLNQHYKSKDETKIKGNETIMNNWMHVSRLSAEIKDAKKALRQHEFFFLFLLSLLKCLLPSLYIEIDTLNEWLRRFNARRITVITIIICSQRDRTKHWNNYPATKKIVCKIKRKRQWNHYYYHTENVYNEKG